MLNNLVQIHTQSVLQYTYILNIIMPTVTVAAIRICGVRVRQCAVVYENPTQGFVARHVASQ